MFLWWCHYDYDVILVFFRLLQDLTKGQNSEAKGNTCNNHVVPRLWHKQQRSFSLQACRVIREILEYIFNYSRLINFLINIAVVTGYYIIMPILIHTYCIFFLLIFWKQPFTLIVVMSPSELSNLESTKAYITSKFAEINNHML